MTTDIIAKLSAIVEPSNVRTDDDSLQNFGKDWTKVYEPAPLAIVFPRTVEQVQGIVKLANAEGFSVVPSGGRTGLSGGAVAANGEVVVSFDYINSIRDFNPTDRTVVCGAGVITELSQ